MLPEGLTKFKKFIRLEVSFQIMLQEIINNVKPVIRIFCALEVSGVAIHRW